MVYTQCPQEPQISKYIEADLQPEHLTETIGTPHLVDSVEA